MSEQKDNRSEAEKLAAAKKIMERFEEEDKPRVMKDNTLGTKRPNESLSTRVNDDVGPAQLPSGSQESQSNTQQPVQQPVQESPEKEPNYFADLTNGEKLLTAEEVAQKNQAPQEQASPFVSKSTDMETQLSNSKLPKEVKESLKEKPIVTNNSNPVSGANFVESEDFLSEYKKQLGESTQQTTPKQPSGSNGINPNSVSKDMMKQIVRETLEEVKLEEEQEIDEGGGIIKLKKGDFIYFAKIYKKAKAKNKK